MNISAPSPVIQAIRALHKWAAFRAQSGRMIGIGTSISKTKMRYTNDLGGKFRSYTEVESMFREGRIHAGQNNYFLLRRRIQGKPAIHLRIYDGLYNYA